MLDAAWVEDHDFDVFHLHFGFDARSPADLDELVAALRRRGKPLVFTVHDLRNPHHLDREAHDRHLDVLVPAADALITLTQGAAAEIRARWGREAVVVPHPHVVPLDVMRRAAAMRGVRGRGPRDRAAPHRPAREEPARRHAPPPAAPRARRRGPRPAGRGAAGQRAP